MLFVANRRLLEGRRAAAGRAVRFDLADTAGRPGAVLRYMFDTMRTGRPAGLSPGKRHFVLSPLLPMAREMAA